MDKRDTEYIAEVSKNNLILQLLKLLGAFPLSTLLVVIVLSYIFSATDSGTFDSKYDLPVVCIAIVLSFSISIITDYNAIQRLKNEAQKNHADMQAAEKTSAMCNAN